MIRLIRKLDTPEPPWATLTLPWAARTNSRLRVLLDNGKEADICLEDDGALRNGDLLASDEGHVVRIHAASEPLSTATCADARTMA
ncbi:MAG: urease accessory protein UreE, partial [Desulfatitalea sp.]|nr:hypothetical protein [Desulfatitalea sp.]NNK00780.1 urease accessory protein UreE [Desulfatitalea sp.]